MVKRLVAIVGCLLSIMVVMSACGPKETPPPLLPPEVGPAESLCVDDQTGAELEYEEAVVIASESPCVDEGSLTDTAQCNTTTGTWWIDMDIERPGCAPACVVDVNTRQAEINWRCTGALPPEDTVTLPTQETVAPPTETPVPTSTPESQADWPRYVNADYGFGFSYPPTWSLELLTDRSPDSAGEPVADAVRLVQGSMEIRVEFKKPEQEATLGPGSLTDGEVQDRGTVTLLDRVLPKHVLVYEGKDKAVFVGERFGDLEFYIQMDDIRAHEAYDVIEIPASAQEDFDRILATFNRIGEAASADPYPGWQTYTTTETVPGFSFRYPPAWTLRELTEPPNAPTLTLRQDNYILTVQYKQADSPDVIGPATTPEGLVMEAGTASFLHEAAPRNVLVLDDKVKMVFLTYRDDALEFYIALTEDPEQVAYADIDLPEAARNEMDQILASFQTLPPSNE